MIFASALNGFCTFLLALGVGLELGIGGTARLGMGIDPQLLIKSPPDSCIIN